MRQPKPTRRERGFTLVELMVGIAVLVLALNLGIATIIVLFGGRELAERSRRAQDVADSAMEALATRITALGAAGSSGGGTFTINADGSASLTASCTLVWCDKLLVDADGRPVNENSSAAGGVGFNAVEAAGTRREFVRRWSIALVPNRPDLREVTVAVFDTDASTQPLSVLTTRVPYNP